MRHPNLIRGRHSFHTYYHVPQTVCGIIGYNPVSKLIILLLAI